MRLPRLLLLLLFPVAGLAGFGQAINYVPPPSAMYFSSDGSGNLGTWTPVTGGGAGVITGVPPAIGMYCSTNGTGNAGTWAPCASGGGGGPRALSCQPGLGDGTNAIVPGTYRTTSCRNETGGTWTLTAIRCVTDSGTSTCNVTNGAGTALLTGAITGSSSYTNGTQSGTTTIASGDFLKITYVTDGVTKQIGIDVAGTY